MSNDVPNILDGYAPQADFAKGYGVHERTVARARREGLPFVEWGGKIWIDVAGARDGSRAA